MLDRRPQAPAVSQQALALSHSLFSVSLALVLSRSEEFSRIGTRHRRPASFSEARSPPGDLFIAGRTSGSVNARICPKCDRPWRCGDLRIGYVRPGTCSDYRFRSGRWSIRSLSIYGCGSRSYTLATGRSGSRQHMLPMPHAAAASFRWRIRSRRARASAVGRHQRVLQRRRHPLFAIRLQRLSPLIGWSG